MKMTTAMASWSSALVTAKLLMAVVVALSLAVGGLAYALVTIDRTIVMVAPDGGRTDAISRHAADRSYLEMWALYFAQTFGNVTPDTVGFIKERVGPLLCPKIYNDAMLMLSDQVATISRERLTLSFDPRGVVVEEATGKVFVNGVSVDRPVIGSERRLDRTFEFVMSVVDYRIQVCGLTSYEGPPRTEKVLAQMREREGHPKTGASP
jgi:conjugal transfer pilus assembly protein TraE